MNISAADESFHSNIVIGCGDACSVHGHPRVDVIGTSADIFQSINNHNSLMGMMIEQFETEVHFMIT